MRAARAKRRAADDRRAIEACMRHIEETLEQIRELEELNHQRREKQERTDGRPSGWVAHVACLIAHDEAQIAKLHAANARRAWFLFERGITYQEKR